MNDMVLRAERDQARNAANQARAISEMYARVCAMLVQALKHGKPVDNVDGHPAFKKSMFEAVGKAFSTRVDLVKVQNADDATPNADPIEMVVVVVEPKSPAPTLLVPKAAPVSVPVNGVH